MIATLHTWIAAAILVGACARDAESAPVPAPTCAVSAVPVSVLVPLVRASLDQKKIPEYDGWVTDQAHMISAGDEAAIEADLEAWKRGSGHEIAVLTVDNLGGRPIEEFALDVARTWALGSKEKNDAALLVVAKSEHKIRIEVGRGLEGNLTDIVCGRIIRDVITPAFRRQEFSSGIRRGVEAMRAAAGGDLSKLPPERVHHDPGLGFILAIVLFGLVIATIVARISHATRGVGHRRRPGGWFWPGTFGGFGGGGFGGFGGGGGGGGGFSGFGGGGGFSGGGASGGW